MATTKDGRAIEFRRDEAARRYVAVVDGADVGEAEFLLTPDLVVFTHTVTDASVAGQGVGSALVRYALEDVRSRGYRALAVCPFVRAFVQRHPDEYADVLYRSPDENAG